MSNKLEYSYLSFDLMIVIVLTSCPEIAVIK